VGSTDSTVTRVSGLENLAALYALSGVPFRSIDTAHAYWSKADSLLSTRGDEYARSQRLWMYESHLGSDFAAGYHRDEDTVRKRAMEAMHSISPVNPARAALLQQLAQVLNLAAFTLDSTGDVGGLAFGALPGTWLLTFDDDSSKHGTLQFTAGPDPAHLFLSWEVRSGGQLKERLMGAAARVGRLQLEADWNGQTDFGQFGTLVQSTGVLTFRLRPGNVLHGEILPFGLQPHAFTIARQSP